MIHSEADVSPEELFGLNDVTSEKGKLKVQKQRTAIKSRVQRLKMRMIAEERFLTPNVSKCISKILQEYAWPLAKQLRILFQLV